MSPTASEISVAADALWEARVRGEPCQPLSQTCPRLTIPQGYAASRLNFERSLRLDRGTVSVGKKIGLTSRAVQKQFGADSPVFGYLTSDMQVESGSILKSATLLQARVEGEAAFLLKRELRGPGVKHSDVVAATDAVAACIEIVDSRVRDWKIRVQDLIADNSASALFVLGARRRHLSELDLCAATMTLKKNGRVEATGRGTACLGDPVLAVAWLANALGDFGEALAPGDVILAGAFGAQVSFQTGDRCEVELEGLGSVSCVYGRAN